MAISFEEAVGGGTGARPFSTRSQRVFASSKKQPRAASSGRSLKQGGGSLSKRRPKTAEAASGALAAWRKHVDASPALKDAFDPSASNFGRFNSHYPKSLREYFHRPRTAVAEMPRRLGKVKHRFERLSTYGLKSDEAAPMKTQIDFLRSDPCFATLDRVTETGTMTDARGDVVPWDHRHHNTYSRCNHVVHEIHKEFFGKPSRLERIPIHKWRGPPHVAAAAAGRVVRYDA